MARVVHVGQMVLLKPNLKRGPVDADSLYMPGVCTRVEAAKALALMAKELGATPVIAESAAVRVDTELPVRRMEYHRPR
jgi:uncharacterized protein (DUF362 family)